MICLTLTEQRIEQALQRLTDYRSYVDMCELRVDCLHRCVPAAVASFPARAQQQCAILETVLTVRRTCDGGGYADSEDARRDLLLSILRHGAATVSFKYIDLELGIQKEDAICAEAAKQNSTIIRSVHQFSPTSIDISTLLEETTANPNEIGKVAVMVDGLEGVCAVMEQLRSFRARKSNAEKRVIVIAMGEYGRILRILSKRLGIYCTYCSVPNVEAAAPGQLDPVTLTRLYDYHGIDKKTALFAIIGNPIAHSKSPQFHNAAFRSHHKNARYIPIKCDSLPAFRRLALLVPLAGFSVTLPHKSDIIRYLRRADRAVRLIGSCNTVVVKHGRWHGHNTDLYGFEYPLRNARILLAHGIRSARDTRKAKALVVGAGGVARTVCVSLLRHGYEIAIVNRSPKRMDALANELRAHYPPGRVHTISLSPESQAQMRVFAALIIQSTSVGMHPDKTGDPIPFYEFSGDEIVYDLIYNPSQTALLTRAARAGCRTISGEHMFLAQALRQSEYFIDRARGRQ